MEVAPLRLRLAEMLHATGDRTGAELELSAAAEIFRDVGAAARLEACRALRRELGDPGSDAGTGAR